MSDDELYHYREQMRRSRGATTCCECGRRVRRGCPYVLCSGNSDLFGGHRVRYRRCLLCHQLADAMPYEVAFGELDRAAETFMLDFPDQHSGYAPGGFRVVQARCRRWLKRNAETKP